MRVPLAIRLLIVGMLLIPSVLNLLPQSDVPEFCELHDDCIYFVSAKSLTDGGGYRVASLPGEPAQTKYPPLYPLLISMAWRLNPNFPSNLTEAVWISWLALPGMLLALAYFYPRMGLSGWRSLVLLALVAVNPLTLTFSTRLLSELLFTALLIATLILTERAAEANAGAKWAISTGVLMGLAYLTRSAGIVALITIPLYFVIRNKPRQAVAFVCGMFPFVAGWMLWAKLHQVHTTDPTLMYYIDYVGYQIYNVSLNGLPLLLWKNLDELLVALGSLILPKIFSSLLTKILAQVIAVAMICGVVRMVRRGQGLAYSLFALASSLLLLIWHFPPNERFVYPLFPLALAGLLVELEHIAEMVRSGLHHVDRGQRVAALFFGTIFALVLAGTLGLQYYVSSTFLQDDAKVSRQNRDAQASAYEWVKQNTPNSAVVLAMRDPLFYLQTGRHSISRRILPVHWYNDDRVAIIDSFRTLVPFAHSFNANYIYYAGVDFGWAVSGDDQKEIDKAIRSSTELTTAFEEHEATVYKLRETVASDYARRER